MTFKKLFPVIGLIIAIAGACKKSNNATPLPTVNPNPIAGYSDSVWGVFVSDRIRTIYDSVSRQHDTAYEAYAVINNDSGAYVNNAKILWNSNIVSIPNNGLLFNPVGFYFQNPAFFQYSFQISASTDSVHFSSIQWQIMKGTDNPALSYSTPVFPEIDSILPTTIHKSAGYAILIAGNISGADSFILDFIYSVPYSDTFKDIIGYNVAVSLLHLKYSVYDDSIMLTPDQLSILPSQAITVAVTAYKSDIVRANNKSYVFKTEYVLANKVSIVP